MADGIRMEAPEFNGEANIIVNINGIEKLKEFAKVYSSMANGADYQNYWKSQERLIEDVIHAYDKFDSKVVKSAKSAQALVKNINALKAMTGMDDISGIVGRNIDGSPVVEQARSMAKEINNSFSVNNFKEAFSAFSDLTKMGADVSGIFKAFNSTKEIESLRSEINKLTNDLNSANEEMSNLSGGSIEKLKQAAEELANIRERMSEEFSTFLKANDFSTEGIGGSGDADSNGRFSWIFDQIAQGTVTAKEAIAEFKQYYSDFLSEASAGSKTELPEDFLESFSTMYERVEKIFSDFSGTKAFNFDDIIMSLESIRIEIEGIRSAIEPIASQLSSAGSASIDGVVTKLEELHTVLSEINGKDFNNVTQILSNGLSPEVAKDNALKQYRDDAAAFALELQNLAPKIAAIINSGIFKGTATQNMLTQSMMSLYKFDTQSWMKSVSMSGVDKVTQRLAEFLPMVEQVNAAIDQMGDVASDNGLEKLKLPEYNLEDASSINGEAKDIFATLDSIALKLDEINTTVKNIFSFTDSSPDYSNIESVVTKIKSYFDDMVSQINQSLSSIGEGVSSNVSSSLNKETEGLDKAGENAADGIKQEQKALEDVESVKKSVAEKESEVAAATKAVGEAADDTADDLREECEVLDLGNNLYAKRTTYFDQSGNPVSRRTTYTDNTGVSHTTRERVEDGLWMLDDSSETDSRIQRYNQITKKLEHAYAQREKITRKIAQINADIQINGDATGSKAQRISELQTMPGGLNEIDKSITALQTAASAYSDLEAGSGRMAAQQAKTNELIRDSAIMQAEFNEKINESKLVQGTTDYNKFYKEIEDQLLKVTEAQNNWTKAKTGETASDYNKLEGYHNALEQLLNDLNGLSKTEAAQRLSEIKKEFSETSKNIRETGKDSKSFTDVLKGVGGAMGGLVTSARLAQAAIRLFREGVKQAIDLQDTLVDLQIVTGSKGSEFDDYATNVSKTAQDIGVATKDLVTATTTFARLGYSLPDSNVLAKYTAMLEKVGGIDPQAAQDSLTAMLAAFPDEVNIQNIEQAMDKLVVVGNNFPISVSQIAEGMNNASASLAAAGNTFDESVALLMGANVTIQNASKASTALRTISARIYKTTSELNELGESVEESKYNDVVAGLTGRGVQIIDEKTGEYRKLVDILRDVANVWKDMTSLEQSALLDTFGATRGRDVLLSLIQNFNLVEEAMSEMGDSSNALENAYSTTFNSITTAFKQFKAAIGGLGYETVEELTPVIKAITGFGTKVVDLITDITKLAKPIGGLETTIPVLTLIITLIKGIASASKLVQGPMIGFKSALFGLGSALTPLQGILIALSAIAIAAKGLDAKIVTYDEQVEKVKELNNEYERLYGIGSEYDDLLNRSTKLTSQERERLSVLQDQERTLKNQIELESRKEFNKWTKKTRRDLLTPGSESLSGFEKYTRQYNYANKRYQSGKISLEEYQEILGGLVKSGEEFAEQYDYYKDLGLDVSAFDSIANWYKGLTDEFNEAMELNTHEYFKKKFKEAWESAADVVKEDASVWLKGENKDIDKFWISTISDDLNRFADKQGKISADAIRAAGERVAALGDTNEFLNEQEPAYIRLKAAAEQYGLSIEDLISVLIELGIVSDEALDSSNEKVESKLRENIDALKAERDALNAAISEQGYSGSVSIETYEALIEKSKDYAYCLEYENGAMQINAEKANALYEAKLELQKAEVQYERAVDIEKYKENAKLIEELEKDYNSLADGLSDVDDARAASLKNLYEENAGLASEISSYDILISYLNDATSAYSKWKNAQNATETGVVYDDARTALEDIKEGLKTGKTGTPKYKAALEFIIPEAERGDVEKYIKSLERYLTEDVSGVQHFLRDAISEGLMIDNVDTIQFADGVTLEDVYSALRITPDMAKAIFGELEEYDFHFEWDDPAAQLGVDLTNVESINAEIQKVEEEMLSVKKNADGIYGDATQQLSKLNELESKLSDLQSRRNEALGIVNEEDTSENLELVISDLNNIQSTVEGLTKKKMGDLGAKSSVAALQTVYDMLQKINNYSISSKTVNISSSVSSGSGVNVVKPSDKNKLIQASAGGTNYSEGGETLVNELGAELISEDGHAYIANGGKPAVIDLSPGAVVINAKDTAKALSGTTYRKPIRAMKSGSISGGGNSSIFDIIPTGNGSGSSSSSKSDKDKEESWFEKLYKYHQHLLAMDQESVADYLRWLNDAYKQAYNEGIIELDDYYKYAEEIYSKLQEHFKDYLNDNEFTIEMLEHQKNATDQINAIYRQLLVDVRAQIDKAYAQGLRDTDDYVQELWQKWWEYYDAIEDLRDSTESDAKDALDELVQYRIKMLEKDLENEKQSYDDRLNSLKEFIDKQKDILRNSADEEDYLKEQADKRKKISDLEAQLAQLEFDDSAWAQKKKLELQEDLTNAREDLQTFERDHAIEMTENELDAIYELSEEASNKQTEIIQKQLDDASILYNKALEDIKNNTQALYDEMVAYELREGTGTADAIKEIWENAYVALQNYMDLFGEFYNDVELKNLTGYTNDVVNTSLPDGATPGYSAPIEGNYNTPNAPSHTTQENTAPSLNVGSYVDVKSGTKWYSDSYGGGDWGYAHGGTIKYTNPGSTHPYNIDGAGWIRKEDIVGYKNGTSSATKGLHAFDEDGSEYIFTSSDGNKYKLFNSGDKVLNSKASQFLYDFANKGASVFNNLTKGLSNMFGNIGSLSPVQIAMGDIIVNGNANELTVSEIRRAQRENVDYMLREFRRLKA